MVVLVVILLSFLSILVYISIAYIIVPWCGVPSELTESKFVDHLFALVIAGSFAGVAIVSIMVGARDWGVEPVWMVLAGILTVLCGAGTAYYRILR